jgi:uncharacterized membrane protein
MRTARAVALPLAAVLWVVILLAAPVTTSSTSGRPGAVVVYRSAALICHQKPERSFAVNGVPMPVCGRCFGLYVAGASGALAALILGRRTFPDPFTRIVLLAIAALPMGLSVGLELLGLVQGSNAIRFASAIPLGVIAGWLMEQVLLDEYRPMVGAPDNRPAI